MGKEQLYQVGVRFHTSHIVIQRAEKWIAEVLDAPRHGRALSSWIATCMHIFRILGFALFGCLIDEVHAKVQAFKVKLRLPRPITVVMQAPNHGRAPDRPQLNTPDRVSSSSVENMPSGRFSATLGVWIWLFLNATPQTGFMVVSF